MDCYIRTPFENFLVCPQKPEKRKGWPDSMILGEYFGNENDYINERYQFYISKISHLGSPMPESNKLEKGPETVTGIKYIRRNSFPFIKGRQMTG